MAAQNQQAVNQEIQQVQNRLDEIGRLAAERSSQIQEYTKLINQARGNEGASYVSASEAAAREMAGLQAEASALRANLDKLNQGYSYSDIQSYAGNVGYAESSRLSELDRLAKIKVETPQLVNPQIQKATTYNLPAGVIPGQIMSSSQSKLQAAIQSPFRVGMTQAEASAAFKQYGVSQQDIKNVQAGTNYNPVQAAAIARVEKLTATSLSPQMREDYLKQTGLEKTQLQKAGEVISNIPAVPRNIIQFYGSELLGRANIPETQQMNIQLSYPYQTRGTINQYSQPLNIQREILSPAGFTVKVASYAPEVYAFGRAPGIVSGLYSAEPISKEFNPFLSTKERIVSGAEAVGTLLIGSGIGRKFMPKSELILTKSEYIIPEVRQKVIISEPKSILEYGMPTGETARVETRNIIARQRIESLGQKVSVEKQYSFLGLKTKPNEIYSGIPYGNKKEYNKAIKELQKTGLTKIQAALEIRYVQPKFIQPEFAGQAKILSVGKNTPEVLLTGEIKTVPKIIEFGQGVKTRSYQSTLDILRQPGQMVSDKGILRSYPQITRNYLTKEGYPYMKLSQRGKTTTAFEQFSGAKYLKSGEMAFSLTPSKSSLKGNFITGYHGTDTMAAKNILTGGIQPAKKLGIGKLGEVYLAKTPEEARGYAGRTVYGKGLPRSGIKPIILEVNIPSAEYLKLAVKRAGKGGQSEMVLKNVPSKYVKNPFEINVGVSKKTEFYKGGAFSRQMLEGAGRTKFKPSASDVAVLQSDIEPLLIGMESPIKIKSQLQIQKMAQPSQEAVVKAFPSLKALIKTPKQAFPNPAVKMPVSKLNLLGYGLPSYVGGYGRVIASPSSSMLISPPKYETSFVPISKLLIPLTTKSSDQVSIFIPKVSERQINILRTQEGNRYVQQLSLTPSLRTFEQLRPVDIQRLLQVQILNQGSKLRLQQIYRMNQFQPSFNIPGQQYFTPRITPPPPIKPRIPIPKTKRTKFNPFKPGKSIGFIPEIKRYGKFIQVSKATSFEKALAEGKGAVRQTLGASFRIKTTSGKFIGLAPAEEFRPSKRMPFTLVQKRGTRLSTLGERAEIKRAKKGVKLF